MKNNRYKIFAPAVCFALAAAFTSCKKENLNPVPQTVLSDATSFSSAARIQQQVFGVYAAIKNGQFLGGRVQAYEDIRGEDWVNVTNNGVTGVGVWNFSVLSSDQQVENMWATGYAAINKANIVLEGIDANNGVIPASLAASYKGEVRFCRALSYFYLQSLYARNAYTADNGALSVPLRLTANKSPEGAALARATQAEVFTQILDDLNFAEANLPAAYGTTGDSNVVRAHKNAAIALKMRVYMNMGKWDEVISEGNKIVSLDSPFHTPGNVPNSLSNSVTAPFRSPYTSPENMFSLPMSSTNNAGQQNGLSQFWTAEFGLNGTGSGILADAGWGAGDARKSSFVTPASGSTPARWTKFNDDVNNYIPIIRYSEVMLNLAEALARKGSNVDSRALALLNAVRHRADPSVNLVPSSKDELINLVLTERRIELLGEGFRSLDVMRLGATFAAKGSVSAVPPGSVSYVWPIPASELLLNNLMVPNQ